MEHVKEKLSEFLDRELPEDESRLVQDHLSACAGCRAALEELKAVSRLVADLPREPLPSGFLARLERRRSRETSRRLFPAPARALAFALSCAVVMLVVYQRFQPRLAPLSGAARVSEASRQRLEQRQLVPAPAPSMARATYRGGGLASLTAAREAAKAPGAPLEVQEAPPPLPSKTYTNEMLHQDLEAQKARMGIVKILPRAADSQTAADLFGAGAQKEILASAARPAHLAGARPALLAARGGQGLAGAGVSLAAGLVARSAEEQRRIWAERSLPAEGPKADYSREMLVVVFASRAGAAVKITDVRNSQDAIIVEYSEAAPAGKASAPYQFRTIPISAKPVAFERRP